MEASKDKLLIPSVQVCQIKSPRGSKQPNQGELSPSSVFQPTQGKSRRWDLIDQVDECNVKIEELLRTGEATMSVSSCDASPVPNNDNEEGEVLNDSEEASWDDLDVAADTILRSLTELSGSNTASSPSKGDEFESPVKRSVSDNSQSTPSTGLSASDEEDEEVEVKTLDCLDDEQLVVDRQCKRGHDLTPHRTPSNMWWCSKCLSPVQKGSRLFGCRLCNYDECWSCLSAAQATVKSRFDTSSDSSPQVASLQQQMSALQEELHGVKHERDVEIAKNRRHQASMACRLWRASWSSSDLSLRAHDFEDCAFESGQMGRTPTAFAGS
jgi:hypothetical protein